MATFVDQAKSVSFCWRATDRPQRRFTVWSGSMTMAVVDPSSYISRVVRGAGGGGARCQIQLFVPVGSQYRQSIATRTISVIDETRWGRITNCSLQSQEVALDGTH